MREDKVKSFEQFINENVDNKTILYHASNNLFDKFELKQGYRTHLFSSELTDAYAIFLTEDIEATKAFGDKYLYKCKINCKRTLDWREALDIRTYEWVKKTIWKYYTLGNNTVLDIA